MRDEGAERSYVVGAGPDEQAPASAARSTTGIRRLNGREVGEGDGLAVSGEPEIAITAVRDPEILIFDLA